jgi:hypothetical protein
MSQEHNRKSFRWLREKVRTFPWFALLAVNVLLYLLPQTYRAIRIFQVASVPALWLWGAYLVRRRRKVAPTVLAIGIALLGFLCLPGSDPDQNELRNAYIRSLKSYEGTRYVWGGENRIGIDCSGLVRNGLINANLRVGISTFNPGPIRRAFAMWWNDCSAQALLEGYRQLTVPLFRADSINSIRERSLAPGDIAVTSDGVHVLAYIGDGRWIQADPGPMKTVITTLPSDDYWFTVPVHVMGWTQLELPSGPEAKSVTSHTTIPKFIVRHRPAPRLDLLLREEAPRFPAGAGDAHHAARIANVLVSKRYGSEPFLGEDFSKKKDAGGTTFTATVGMGGNDLSATVRFAEGRHPCATLRVLTSGLDHAGPSGAIIETNQRGEP